MGSSYVNNPENGYNYSERISRYGVYIQVLSILPGISYTSRHGEYIQGHIRYGEVMISIVISSI